MFVSIRYDKGLGNNALYVRACDASGKFWNFATRSWIDTDIGPCRIFMAEDLSDTDTVSSRYFVTVGAPSSSVLLEIVALATGDVVGEEEPPVPPTVIIPGMPTSSPGLVGGGSITDKIDPAQRPPPTSLEQSDLPNANIRRLEDFIALVRAYMRDYPELNRLVAGEESSNRQIAWAVLDTIDDFNTSPPFTSFGLTNFPSRSLLLRGVVCTLLESIGLLQTRNHLQFSDGGITVGINDKTPFLQSWIQIFRNAYEDKKMRLKVAYNIEAAWGGGIFSEFRFINNFYGEW